jgi:hypothetical protein
MHVEQLGFSVYKRRFLETFCQFPGPLIIARLKNSSCVLFAGSQAMDTICATLKDYFEDYQFLKPKNFKMVIEEAQVFTGSLLLIRTWIRGW